MGLVIGIPVYLAAIFARTARQTGWIFLKAAMLVVLITLAIGLGALAFAYAQISLETLPSWMSGRRVSDPVAFARAGTMHNNSYLGGLIGLVVGTVYAFVQARRTRA